MDPDLATTIEDLMFVFDNLKDIDDRGIQALLREVSSEVLVVALKGSDEEVKEKIFKNMSKRAAELLQDDLEAKGPVKVSEEEAAKKDIITVARRTAGAGELPLGRAGEDVVSCNDRGTTASRSRKKGGRPGTDGRCRSLMSAATRLCTGRGCSRSRPLISRKCATPPAKTVIRQGAGRAIRSAS